MYNRLIVENDPKSPISEAFRNMRTNIYFSNVDNDISTIIITSPQKANGKSTILSNYALTLAQTGKRVLVVDCDLRRPNIHRIFHSTNNIGLTNVLIKEVKWEEAVQITKINNVFIMPSGPIPPNPSEMLGSSSMKKLLGKLRDSFDYVLLDAPPIGIVTDAAILSTIAEGVIIAIAVGETEKELYKRTIESLKNVGANILGIVINKAPVNRGNYYYNYYYNDYQDEKKDSKGKRKRKNKKKVVGSSAREGR